MKCWNCCGTAYKKNILEHAFHKLNTLLYRYYFYLGESLLRRTSQLQARSCPSVRALWQFSGMGVNFLCIIFRRLFFSSVIWYLASIKEITYLKNTQRIILRIYWTKSWHPWFAGLRTDHLKPAPGPQQIQLHLHVDGDKWRRWRTIKSIFPDFPKFRLQSMACFTNSVFLNSTIKYNFFFFCVFRLVQCWKILIIKEDMFQRGKIVIIINHNILDFNQIKSFVVNIFF